MTDLSREALERAQLASLNSLLPKLTASNRFYAERIAAAGMQNGAESLDEFRRRMPFTTKQELVEDQRRSPPFGSNHTLPIERYARFTQTSGTSGTPMRWLDTPENWDWMIANWIRVFQAAGVDTGDRIFFAFSFGPFIGFWLAFDAGTRLGCLCIPGGGMSSAARLGTILDTRATVLCCTPTYALHLAEVAAEAGIDLTHTSIKKLVVAGEPGASIPSTRRRLEKVWAGARAADHHGMTETGPVSYECPEDGGGLHVMEEAFLAEIVHPQTGLPVEPGVEGELVLTTLGRADSPVLRYRTGDLVRRSTAETCACGSCEWLLEGGIVGRADDMIVVRGVNVHPSAVEDVIRRFAGVAEYRVEVSHARALPEIRIDLEPAHDCRDTEALAREVEAALRTTFNLRFPASIAPPGTLPRFEHKARRWIRS